MKKEIKKCYTFDDVLLVPQYVNFKRAKINLGIQLSKNIFLKLPVLSAAMDTVTEAEMAISVSKSGGLGCIHKNMSIDDIVDNIKKVKNTKLTKLELENASLDEKNRLLCAVAISLNLPDYQKIGQKLVDAGVDAIVLDTAHAYREVAKNIIENLKKHFPNLTIIAGNVVSANATKFLIEAGADVIKVGIGSGSICTTRAVTGTGKPQLSAIFDCFEVAKKYNIPIISDGGIKNSGDIIKALAAGASAIMTGSLLAGTTESPLKYDNFVDENSINYKYYRGMGSLSALIEGSGDRYGQEKVTKYIPEGVEGYIKAKGSAKSILQNIKKALISGLWYQGSLTIPEMWEKSEFVLQTNLGLKESNVSNRIKIINK